MLAKYRQLQLLLIVGSLLVTPAAKAGVFKGHPYHDPHASVPSSSGTTWTDSGVAVSPHTTNCCPAAASGFPTEHLHDAHCPPPSFGPPAMPGGSAGRPNCPPVTNALLRVWVDDGAIVWVNGVRTMPQHLAGIHRGSRIFSLAGLVPGEIQEAIVQVQYCDACSPLPNTTPMQEKRELVQPGGSYDVRFAEWVIAEEVSPIEFLTPADDAIPTEEIASKIEAAAKRSEDAAGKSAAAALKATAAAKQAEDAIKGARAEIAKQLATASKFASDAAQSAKQAARTNSETFEFLDNGKPLVAWVKYKDDGSLAAFDFDGPTTRSKLSYKETSDALKRLRDVEIAVNYHFTIQIPDAAAPGGFRDETTFAILGRIAKFDAGAGQVNFFDRAHPAQHLSAQFKTELLKHWSKRYDGGRVKVEISAVRPNGTETPVAPVGNRITIELRGM